MTITLITASFNSAAVIGTALESVLRQTWPAIEYWIIDGGSSDGTLDVIREYEPKFNGRLRWVSEPDRGMYDAINKGIRLATGEVVGILNADDVLAADDVIAKVAGEFGSAGVRECGSAGVRECGSAGVRECGSAGVRECGSAGVRECGSSRVLKLENAEVREPGSSVGAQGRFSVEVIYGDIRFISNRSGDDLDALRGLPTLRYYSARHWRPWMLQWGFMPPHPSVYVRRECFERLGLYALDYEIAADYALLIGFLRQASLPSRYLPLCMVDMRLGGRSTRSWRSNLQLNREIVRGNREAGYFCCLPMLLPKYVFKVWEFLLPRIRRAGEVSEW